MTDAEPTGAPSSWADRLGLFAAGSGVITGTVVCAAVIAASAGQIESSAQLSAAILATVFVYWLAHLHADAIGGAASMSHHPVRALRLAIKHTWTIAAASLLPLAVLLVAAFAGADQPEAAWAALIATIGLLAAYSFIAGRRGGLGLGGSLACSAAGAALGIVVAALKAALH